MMERCFIVTKESELLQAIEKYRSMEEDQRIFVNQFMVEKGIKSNGFIISGNGWINKPFENYEKKDINLSIEPTKEDIENFENILKKPNKNHGLCSFKKNSSIAKEFSQRCVDEKIVINLWKPRVSDYFGSLAYKGCSLRDFTHDDKFYLEIRSDHLSQDEMPNGFIEIKQIEYYQAKEDHANEQNNNAK